MSNNEEAVQLDLDDLRKQLLDLKAHLEHDIDVKEREVAESGDDLVPERGGVSNHMADDANETSEQETMLGLQRSSERQLNQVNEALARMDAGTYGTCANCGKPINPARLEVHPSSTLCMDCQRLSDNGRL
jgi:RNA polymerase-binding protein DksA